MKYTFHSVDVFSSTPFAGGQIAVLPKAAGISAAGMQKIAREFNFSETTFVLPANDPANTCRVRIFAPVLGVEENPATGSACAALVGAMAARSDFGGAEYRLSIQQGVLDGAP